MNSEQASRAFWRAKADHGTSLIAAVMLINPCTNSAQIMIRRVLLGLTCLSLLTVCGFGSEGPTDEGKLQGEWRVTSMRVKGQDLNMAARGEIVYLFTKNRLKIAGFLTLVTEFTLRPDTKPKQLDLKVVGPFDSGKKAFGIYRFDGKKLVLCIGEARPSKFSSDDDATLVVLERRKTDG